VENGLFADRVAIAGRKLEQSSLADVSNGDGTSNTIMYCENVKPDEMAVRHWSWHPKLLMTTPATRFDRRHEFILA
jgi:hypothetical protein